MKDEAGSPGNLNPTHRFERCSEKPPWRVRERRKISVKADGKKSSFCSAKTMERRGAWCQPGEKGTENGTGRYQQSISISSAAAAFPPAVARTLVQKVRPPADAPHARRGVGDWGPRHTVLPDWMLLHSLSNRDFIYFYFFIIIIIFLITNIEISNLPTITHSGMSWGFLFFIFFKLCLCCCSYNVDLSI